MKKLFYLSILIITILFTFSCSKDEDDDILKIPNGWTVNGDLDVLENYSWYLYRTNQDSIKIHFSWYMPAYDYGYISWEIYKKDSYKRYYWLDKAHSIEKDGVKNFFGKLKGNENYNIKYEIIDDKTVRIFQLPETGSSAKWMDFKAVNEYTYNDKNSLIGGWYNSQVVDSTVLVFEDKNIKEYLFVRGSTTISDSWEYGDYKATLTKAYLEEELLGTNKELKFADYSTCTYKINADKLTVYWKSPGKTTTYTRIKQ